MSCKSFPVASDEAHSMNQYGKYPGCCRSNRPKLVLNSTTVPRRTRIEMRAEIKNHCIEMAANILGTGQMWPLIAGDIFKPGSTKTVWHEKTFQITGPLWMESAGNQWIPITKGQ